MPRTLFLIIQIFAFVIMMFVAIVGFVARPIQARFAPESDVCMRFLDAVKARNVPEIQSIGGGQYRALASYPTSLARLEQLSPEVFRFDRVVFSTVEGSEEDEDRAVAGDLLGDESQTPFSCEMVQESGDWRVVALVVGGQIFR